MDHFFITLCNSGLNICKTKLKKQLQCMGDYKKLNFHLTDEIVIGITTNSLNNNEQQPFCFHNNRYCLAFNGIIYNTVVLRRQLELHGYTFETESEMEVIAYLFLEKGVKAFAQLRGMYSLIIWDHHHKIMYGARDHFGIKPLYYLEDNEKIIVSTDKKGIICTTELQTIDKQSFQHYLTFQYVPEPMTITEKVFKLKPGHYFVKEINMPVRTRRYFYSNFHSVLKSSDDMEYQIRKVISNSVYEHVKDKKSFGAFLSGGVDSSIITALAKKHDPKLKTFSVGFRRDGYSEIDEARSTADQLNVENISYEITPEEYISVIPDVIMNLDNPLADPSCIPLYIAAREAKKHVDTVVSGEGADEFFGGYNIYCEPESLKVFNYLPKQLNKLLNQLANIFPEGVKGKSFIKRGTTSLKDRYVGNAKIFEENEKQELIINYNKNFPYKKITEKLFEEVKHEESVLQMQYIDLHTWLPGNILLKANMVASAHSLDLRLPFLDKEVFKVARLIPVDEKVKNRKTKIILREAFRGTVPDDALFRKKLGFPVPLKYWLKNELYTWATEVIRTSETDYLLDKELVMVLLNEHKKDHKDYARKLWTILIFMVWHQMYVEKGIARKENLIANV